MTNNSQLTADSKQRTPISIGFSILFVVCCLLLAPSADAQVNVQTQIVPTNITLVWEADSYVPPFYKGKALMPDGGDARIVAILPPGIDKGSNIRYTWRVDGTVDGNASGYGRDVYQLRSDMFGGQSFVVVEVHNGDSLIGSGALRIPLAKPQVLVYADAPLGGVLFNVENPRLGGEELSIETYPAFFSTQQRDARGLSYKWRVNGSTVTNPLGNTGRLSVRSESTGATTISVSVINSNNILESATGQIMLFLE